MAARLLTSTPFAIIFTDSAVGASAHDAPENSNSDEFWNSVDGWTVGGVAAAATILLVFIVLFFCLFVFTYMFVFIIVFVGQICE